MGGKQIEDLLKKIILNKSKLMVQQQEFLASFFAPNTVTNHSPASFADFLGNLVVATGKWTFWPEFRLSIGAMCQ